MSRNTSMLDGKRGRTKGTKSRPSAELDLRWVYAHLGDDPETVECKRPTAREMLKWVQRSDANMNVFMKRVLTQGLGKGQGPEAAQMEQTEPDDPSDVRLDALLKELEADWAKENDGAK